MIAKRFLVAGWSMQLLVGCVLFIVSLFFEAQILAGFFQSVWLAWALAMALELGKALAIVWYRLSASLYPAAILLRVISAAFRVGLIVLSLLCTLLFLANFLDKPALNQAMSADQLQLSSKHKAEWQQHRQSFIGKQQHLSDTHSKNLQQIDALYLPEIEALRSNLNNEMNNVIRGTFRGPRYREFERLLELELGRHQAEIQRETNNFKEQLARINDTAEEKRKSLENKHNSELQGLQTRNYSLDKRANDPHVVAFINLVAEVSEATLKPLQFVFFFSILLSVLVELGIWLAFDTVTSFVLPELVMQRDHDIAVAQQQAHEQQRNAAYAEKEQRQRNKVVSQARHTVAQATRAKEYFNNAA